MNFTILYMSLVDDVTPLSLTFPTDTVFMKNLENMKNFENRVINFVILEDEICYDWDDYCVWGAVLYDIANKSIVTTKYGHGTDMSERAESIELADAVENGVITIEELIDVLVSKLGIGMPNMRTYAACHSLENPTSVPVKVTGGRKFKGNGYLVYALTEPCRYGWGAYHNEYNYYPVVFDPATKTFNKVNSFEYLEYSDETREYFVSEVRRNIENTISEAKSLAHAWAYEMSYSACDTENRRHLINKYALRGTDNIEVAACVLEGIEIENERKRVAREKLKAEKMPGIIAWVKANTDKTGDDIITLAEHIFNKHN